MMIVCTSSLSSCTIGQIDISIVKQSELTMGLDHPMASEAYTTESFRMENPFTTNTTKQARVTNQA